MASGSNFHLRFPTLVPEVFFRREEKKERKKAAIENSPLLCSVSLIAASWLFGRYFIYVYYSVSYYIYMISI